VQPWQPISGCNVSSRRPPSEGGGRECNSLHPDHFWKAGRYKLAAPVSKTGSAQTRGRSVTDAVRQHLTPNERKSYATCDPLPKSVALPQELQTKSCHSNPTSRETELHFSSDATVRFKAAIGTRPLAQKQSTRLISGRPRSVTARDD